MNRDAANEAFGMSGKGSVQNVGALLHNMGSIAGMDDGGCEESEIDMMVLVVVPIEKSARPVTSFSNGVKMVREVGAVFKCLELSLRKWIIVRRVRSAMCLGNTERCKQLCSGQGNHGGAIVGVESELVTHDMLLATALLNQLLGKCSRFLFSHHPTDDIAAKDIENHIEIEIDVLVGCVKLGDVPRPQLVGGSGC